MGTKNNRHSALTLIELLIVVAIVGLLAILAISLIRRQIYKGNDANRKGDLNRIQVAAEEYEKDHNCYPTVIECGEDSNQQVYPYLKNVPCDPVTNESYAYEPETSTSCPSWYRIYSSLENLADTAILSSIGPGGIYNYYVGSANAPSPVVTAGGGTPTPAPTQGGAVSGYWGCMGGLGGTCEPVEVSSPGQPVCNPTYNDANCGVTNGCTAEGLTFPCIPVDGSPPPANPFQ
jgi:prepilin-type N-terminal cleavage/methylation domain-containing protein